MISILIITIIIILSAFALFYMHNKNKKKANDKLEIAKDLGANKMQPITPPLETTPIHTKGMIITNGGPNDSAIFSCEIIDDEKVFQRTKSVSNKERSIELASSLMTMIPETMLLREEKGKMFMEVVINGDLVRAKDGNGLRAWTVDDKKKYKEHARLFETKKLSELVNLTAVMQLGSFIFAQQHLADINKKLDEIKSEINNVKIFQQQERRSNIHGIYAYIITLKESISSGYFPTDLAIRSELESCETKLLSIQSHISMEIKDRQKVTLISSGFLDGTKDDSVKVISKIHEMDTLIKEIRSVIYTRLVLCNIISLFPEQEIIARIRIQNIRSALTELEEIQKDIEIYFKEQTSKIKSLWSSPEITRLRRVEAKTELQKTLDFISLTKNDFFSYSQKIEYDMIDKSKEQKLLIEIENGSVSDVRCV